MSTDIYYLLLWWFLDNQLSSFKTGPNFQSGQIYERCPSLSQAQVLQSKDVPNSTQELRQPLPCQAQNHSVTPPMPSHKAFDKQCLNTHSRPNPTVIRPSESSSFPSANAQKLFRFILPWQVSICTSLNTKLLCSMLSADLDALFCD